jgi:hypothetical protein
VFGPARAVELAHLAATATKTTVTGKLQAIIYAPGFS